MAHAIRYTNTTNLPALSGQVPEKFVLEISMVQSLVDDFDLNKDGTIDKGHVVTN